MPHTSLRPCFLQQLRADLSRILKTRNNIIFGTACTLHYHCFIEGYVQVTLSHWNNLLSRKKNILVTIQIFFITQIGNEYRLALKKYCFYDWFYHPFLLWTRGEYFSLSLCYNNHLFQMLWESGKEVKLQTAWASEQEPSEQNNEFDETRKLFSHILDF